MGKNIWNTLTAAIITTLIGCLGYVLSSISDIQKREAAQEALEFTSKDAIQLQQKLTDVMTDIDLRISLVERDIQWVKIIQPRSSQPPSSDIPSTTTQTPKPDAQPTQPPPDPPVPPFNVRLSPPSNVRSSPRYDLRDQSHQSLPPRDDPAAEK